MEKKDEIWARFEEIFPTFLGGKKGEEIVGVKLTIDGIKRSKAEIKHFLLQVMREVREDERNVILAAIESEMLDKIYYIGNELPQAPQNDKRDKFVLLGFPAKFLDDVKNRLQHPKEE